MNIIFAHDHKLRFIDGEYYTLGGLADNVTERYTKLFGNLILICRAIPKQSYDKKMFRLTNESIEINAIHTGAIHFSKQQKKQVRELVRNSDAVILRIPSFVGNIVYKYAKEFCKPIFSEVVTCPWDSLWNYGYKGKILAPFMVYKTKIIARNSDYILYVTEHFLQNRYPTNGISCGCSDVELEIFDTNTLDKRIKKIKNYDRKRITIGTLAALNTSYKGQQYVIHAMSLLKKHGIVVMYKLAGGGSSEFLLNEARRFGVHNQIQVDGVIPHDKVFDWIDDLDLYIQPSLQEGLPRAVVEAMSCACPIIGSRAGGIPELLPERCIFEKKDWNGLARLIKAINEEDLLLMAKENYDKSKLFQKHNLDIKRQSFYKEFYEFVRKRQNSNY